MSLDRHLLDGTQTIVSLLKWLKLKNYTQWVQVDLCINPRELNYNKVTLLDYALHTCCSLYTQYRSLIYSTYT